MKKLFTLLAVASLTLTASAIDFVAQSFLSPYVGGGYLTTNAAGTNSVNYTNAYWGGINVTNAASAPLGGLTNLLSWNNSTTAPINQGTNCPRLTWTNSSGVWVIPTNGVPGTLAGVQFKQGPDKTTLLQDVIIPVPPNAGVNFTLPPTNNWDGTVTSLSMSAYSLSARVFGDAGAGFGGGNMNFLFVGLPDGTNEPPDVSGACQQRFIWGIPQIVGPNVCCTNFPMWKFAGCKKIRLRNAWLANTSSNNATMTIQSLTLNGPLP
jgi:hypothetical protein